MTVDSRAPHGDDGQDRQDQSRMMRVLSRPGGRSEGAKERTDVTSGSRGMKDRVVFIGRRGMICSPDQVIVLCPASLLWLVHLA